MNKKLIVIFLSVILLFASCKNTKDNITNNSPDKTTKTNTIEPNTTAKPVKRDVFYYFISDGEFAQLSETEYSEIENLSEADVLSVVTEYYDNKHCSIKIMWLNSPRYSKKVNINIDNVILDSGTGIVVYDTKCKGISNIFDLNHIYRNNRSYSFEELDIVPEKNDSTGVKFAVNIEKGIFCPYYIGPTRNAEYFQEHTVEWNEVALNYYCTVFNKNKNVEVNISSFK
ncbi:MAG: hypothetical protein E7388_06950 [Ruminococcaceae bacterium]|nr:hypothetical protein [Oscillospiraceae bacterium]